MPCLQPRILEFMGPAFLKPWNWWTYTILDLSWEYLALKESLPHNDSQLLPFIGYLFISSLVMLSIRLFLKSKTRVVLARKIQQRKALDTVVILQSLVVGFGILLSCMYFAFSMINPSMHPSYAMFTFLLWSHIITPSLYFTYCVLSFVPQNQ